MSDALLIVSFGGPEHPTDVEPFLNNVARGRDIPPARRAAVAAQYQRFGGVSPLNAQCRALKAEIEVDLAAHGIALPVYWGNRNWHPLLGPTVESMRRDGVKRVFAFITSPYSSYSSCRQYLDELTALGCPPFVRLGPFFDHAGFIGPMSSRTARALESTPERTRVLFTAHSIPLVMDRACDYRAQVEIASALVAERCAIGDHRVVWQSRSGPPQMPWLEPDINDAIRDAAADGVREVVVVPIGFISDHMEVVYDLDVTARETAAACGIAFRRAGTVGVDQAFVAMVRELLGAARANSSAPRRYCAAGCCPATIHQ